MNLGDFNGWSRDSHACSMESFGVWTLDMPDRNGIPVVAHDSR
jgi:1,4-alpha-glucan branching enzyme